MKKLLLVLLVTSFSVVVSIGTGFAGWDPGKTQQERKAAEDTIANFKAKDPGIERFFDSAYGYAVFPTIGKGGLVLGFARGKGLVYEKGKIVGRATLVQGTVGAQIGGQSYSEIIFLQDKVALDNLKNNKLKFAAQASAIAVTAGASADAAYEGGVAVFTLPKGGLMAEASIGGQEFKFEPKSK